MKKLLLFSAITCLLTFTACKKASNKNAIVVRDCTGTYLRLDGKDYHVCNLEKVASFSDGTSVNASFKLIEECNGSAKEEIVCMMLHANEGWIEIQKIN